MKPALWLLIGLQLRGWLRYGFRGLRTVKGAILATLGFLVFVPWLISLLVRASDARGLEPGYVHSIGPAALAGYCLLNLLLSGGDNALYFTPAEIGFLFPAPLSRRQLVAYKLASTALVGVPTALVLTALVYPYGHSFLFTLAGVALILAFMHLFNTSLQLVIAAVGSQLFRRGKRLVLVILVLAAAAVVGTARWQGGPDFVQTVLADLPDATACKVALQPFSWFIEVCLARRLWPEFSLFALLSLLVDLILLALVFTLDTISLEGLAASSARLYTRIQRLRGRPVAEEIDQERGFLVAFPPLPRLGGMGPLLWRQLTSALRQPWRLVLGAIPFSFLLIGPLLATPDEAARALPTAPLLVQGTLGVSLFLTALFPYDFRADVDRIAILKTLPLPTWRLVLGQLAAPVLIVSCCQAMILAVLHLLLPGPQQVTTVAACFILPFNFLLFAQENLLFLLFPLRVAGANPGDFQHIGKNLLVLVARVFGIGMVAAAAGVAGVAAYFLSGGSMATALALVWLVVAGAGAALVPLLAIAFGVFDVSRDAPA